MANSIPIVLVLWEHPNFGGIKRTLISDAQETGSGNFNDKASSIGVHAGPGLATAPFPPTVSVFEHPNFKGAEAVLGVGTYADLGWMGFNDNISSVQFNTQDRKPGIYRGGFQKIVPLNPPQPIAEIPLIVTLLVTLGIREDEGRRITLVQPSRQIQPEYGTDFNDSVVSVYVRQGPNYAGHLVRVHRDPDFLGGHIDLDAPKIKEADQVHTMANSNFGSVISSIQFVNANGKTWRAAEGRQMMRPV